MGTGDAASDATRDRLVQAAAEVFAEKGYDRAGVQEIARRAGLTTGAIYGRFTGKAELLLEAIDSKAEDEFDELFSQHRFEGRATDILSTVGAHLVTHDDGDRGHDLLLEAIVTARRDPEVAAKLGARVDHRAALLGDLIEEAKLDGSVGDDLDTLALVRFCHAVSLGFLCLEALDLDLPDETPWAHLIERLVGALAQQTEPLDLTEQEQH
jgi:AcrR family transcriptional regulator